MTAHGPSPRKSIDKHSASNNDTVEASALLESPVKVARALVHANALNSEEAYRKMSPHVVKQEGPLNQTPKIFEKDAKKLKTLSSAGRDERAITEE
jgi:hypothetical protein